MSYRTLSRLWVLGIGIFLLAISCENTADTNGESVQEILPSESGSNADIIRNPVTADKETDRDKLAVLTFEEESYDFGEIDEGEVVKHTFTFTNTGKVPLVINNARSTCGCTIPKWPKEPIAPGESGKIRVRFNSEGKYERQKKPITITANTYPNNTVIYLEGYVNSDKKTAENN